MIAIKELIIMILLSPPYTLMQFSPILTVQLVSLCRHFCSENLLDFSVGLLQFGPHITTYFGILPHFTSQIEVKLHTQLQWLPSHSACCLVLVILADSPCLCLGSIDSYPHCTCMLCPVRSL